MRESVGNTWVFQLVIIFILLLAGYITVTINYGKSYRLKNEVLSIIERHEGLTAGSNGAIAAINTYLRGYSYTAVSHCEPGYYGAKSLDSYETSNMEYVTETNANNNYYYCVRKIKGYNQLNPTRAYYEIMLFSKFDLPVIGKITNFKATGRTAELEVTYDSNVIKYHY